MKSAGAAAAAEREEESAHPGRPWWLVVAVVPLALVFVLCLRDATAWVGRPFAGFLFSDSRIVVSIGRASWRPAQLRRVEWSLVTAVDGQPTVTAAAVHAAVGAAGVGRERTYTFARGPEVFRLALPVRPFTWGDFAVVLAPMLGVGALCVVVGAVLVALRADLPEARALFAVCQALGLALLTGPDQYGPYRFTWLFFFSLAALPPALLQLTAACWRPSRGVARAVAGLYVVFAVVGGLLFARRFEPSVFLPLLYLVYCTIANALLLYVGTLVSALVSRRRPRAQVTLALAAILVSSIVAIGVNVAYPLIVGPISAPWFILPMGLWPVLSGIAFVGLAGPRAAAGNVT